MLAILRFVGWIFVLVLSTIPGYWFLVHPRAEYWRQKRGARFKILGPLWIMMWVAMGAITWPWRHVLLYHTPYSWLPGAALVGLGFYLYRRAHATFTLEQLAGRPEIEGNQCKQRLVTTGIHARVRHPVYLGHLCELLGWSIGTGMAAAYGLMVFAVVTGALMIRMEDDELEQRFGDSYGEYRSTTPALVPRIHGARDRIVNHRPRC